MKSIEWKNGKARIIDQTKLPGGLVYLDIADIKQMWRAIKELKVRGAPAIGAAGALGVYLGVRDSRAAGYPSFRTDLRKSVDYLASSRPTAKNLFWALSRMMLTAEKNSRLPVEKIKKLLLQEARAIMTEDAASCEKIGVYGAGLFRKHDRVLTVCNAGALATAGCGTALGVIYKAHGLGRVAKVYSCETRPLLQGARLTCYELRRHGVDVTLICDNTAATLMAQGKIDRVVAGADRIASNGDAANKIGTYALAVLARYHKIPFYIAAPVSTFDFSISSGVDIPIEERDPAEVTGMFFRSPIAPSGVNVYNPAFDVTPAGLISSIITDRGVLVPPYSGKIKDLAKTACGK
ncbi:MAG: S-methyl-5-thioribose-1-phosphate isomerase [Candidatus Omnitrophota bacterium]